MHKHILFVLCLLYSFIFSATAFADLLSDVGLLVADRDTPTSAWRVGIQGVRPTIKEVLYDSQAELLGLKSGDVILAVGGKNVDKTAELRAMPQLQLPIVVLRGLERLTLPHNRSDKLAKKQSASPAEKQFASAFALAFTRPERIKQIVNLVKENREISDHVLELWQNLAINTDKEEKLVNEFIRIHKDVSIVLLVKDKVWKPGTESSNADQLVKTYHQIKKSKEDEFEKRLRIAYMSLQSTPEAMKATLEKLKTLGEEESARSLENYFEIALAAKEISSTALTDNNTPELMKPPDFPNEPILRLNTGMHTAKIERIDLDRSGRWLVSASHDKTVRLWDLKAGSGNHEKQNRIELVSVLRTPIGEGQDGTLFSVAITPDASMIAAAGIPIADKLSFIYLFSRKDSQLVALSVLPRREINHLTFSADSHFLAAATDQGVRIFSTKIVGDKNAKFKMAPLVANLPLRDVRSFGVDFSPDGKRLVVSSLDGNLRLYDVSDLSETYDRKVSSPKVLSPILIKKAPGGSIPMSVKFSPDGKKIAVGFDYSSNVNVISAQDLSFLYAPDTTGLPLDASLASVTWSVDGKELYAAGAYSTNQYQFLIRRWHDAGRGEHLDLLSEASDTITSLAATPDGDIVFSSSDPAIGIFGREGAPLSFLLHDKADYRGMSLNKKFLVSHDGATVDFSIGFAGKHSAIFSISDRNIFSTSDPKINKQKLFSPDKESLPVNLRDDQLRPTLNGHILKLHEGERSRSLAIAPDKKSFLLGASWHLMRFDKTGKLQWKITTPEIPWAVNISPNGRLAVVAYADGTIRWFDYANGKELVALFIHKDQKSWIMWTPEGYFDVSPGAFNLIGYHLNQGEHNAPRFISVKDLYDVFYRPDIVQAKFQGTDIAPLITLTAKQALKNPPPVVSITTSVREATSSTAKICYQVTSSGGGIGEVRLFQNGKLIKSDGFYREAPVTKNINKNSLLSNNSRAIYDDMRGLRARSKADAGIATLKAKGNRFDECIDVEAIPGENEIAVSAFNATNTVQSSIESVKFLSKRKPEEPHLYILTIGTDNYKDQVANLKYAVKDAKDFAQKLSPKAASMYKAENIHLTMLANPGKNKVLDAIEIIEPRIKHGDAFILFVASHGVLIENQYYVVTGDYGGVLDNKTTISTNELVNISKRIRSLSQLYIFDTCHAGGVDNIVNGLYDARMSVMARKMGLHIYASAGSTQTALDGYQGNGLFTHTLLSGIESAKDVDKEKLGNVTFKSLGEYSKIKTAEISSKLGHPQTPYIINFGRDTPLFKVE